MTYERAKAIWRYDPETGLLHWLEAARKPVGPTASRYYVSVGFEGRSYKAHRLAWLLTFGEWPKDEIDHIDGDRSNNRLGNLRDVPHKVNQMNQKCHRGVPHNRFSLVTSRRASL